MSSLSPTTLETTPVVCDDLELVLSNQRAAFLAEGSPATSVRKQRIAALRAMVED